MSENQPFQKEFYNKVFDLLFVKHQDMFLDCIDKGTWNRYDEDGGGCSKQPKTYFKWKIGNKTYKLFYYCGRFHTETGYVRFCYEDLDVHDPNLIIIKNGIWGDTEICNEVIDNETNIYLKVKQFIKNFLHAEEDRISERRRNAESKELQKSELKFKNLLDEIKI